MTLLRVAGSTSRLPGVLARRQAMGSLGAATSKTTALGAWRSSPSCMQPASNSCTITTASGKNSGGSASNRTTRASDGAPHAKSLSLQQLVNPRFHPASSSIFPFPSCNATSSPSRIALQALFDFSPVCVLTNPVWLDDTPLLYQHHRDWPSQTTTCTRHRSLSSRRCGMRASPTAS